MALKAPWLRYYGNVPAHIEYPDCSMCDLVLESAERYPDNVAVDFYGAKTTFRELARQIGECARALAASGIGRGDCVTICMPNTPQAVVMFYAVNMVGAVSNMVHPLSAEEEIVFYTRSSGSVAALTLDQFYPKFMAVMDRLPLRLLIVSGIDDGLCGIKKAAYHVREALSKSRARTRGKVVRWADFIRRGKGFRGCFAEKVEGGDIAAILYSGGTSGTVKGVMLTNLNFNALAMQTAAASGSIAPGQKMLAVMPIFHGFGLGVCVHTALASAGTSILVPKFTPAAFMKLLKTHRPHYIAGVPTLYEALLRLEDTKGLDLSRLEGVFCGGDTLTVELKRRVDEFLRAHGAKVQIREGYGLTECVTASCLTPRDYYREGSIGIPFPDMYYKIVRPGTREEVPYGEVGEICLTGPTLMKGYIGSPEETFKALRIHPDGLTWLHTGDLGSMDEDGFVYFHQRMKRVIVSSGYSIYPTHIENAISSHEKVLSCCVIGVPDPYKMQRVKAFVVLRPGVEPTEEVRASIMEHCKKRVAKYALPSEIEFRDALPKTLVGKVAYAALEREEEERARAAL